MKPKTKVEYNNKMVIRNLMGKSGVVILTHKTNGMSYVGTTKNLYSRYTMLKNAKNDGSSSRSPIKRAIYEEGFDAFHFEYDECPREALIETAAQWIEALDSVENGYNVNRNPHLGSSKTFNDPEAICKVCGINKVFSGDNGGSFYVSTKCMDCINRNAKNTQDKRKQAARVVPKMDVSLLPKKYSERVMSGDNPTAIKRLKDKVGIFVLTHKTHGLSYVGTSTNLKRSYNFYKLIGGAGNRTSEIENAIDTYGFGEFRFSWELCSKNMLKERAAYWRDRLDSVENGYNRQYHNVITAVKPLSPTPKVDDKKTPQAANITPPSDKWSADAKSKLACVVILCVTAIVCVFFG